MKFPFLFKSPETTTTTTWPWPSCATHSKTLSFRADANGDIIQKTINPANKNNSENGFSHHHYDEEMMPCEPETSIRGLRSERFFFEPGKSNSILEEAKTQSPNVAAATMEIESRDPILDFRVSMEEMVEAHGLRDWASLENLLACYLRVNGGNNHAYIIGAFVDLLFSSSSPSSSSATHEYSFTSPLSFSSSSTYSSASACNLSNSLENEQDDISVVIQKTASCDSDSSLSSSSFLGNASSSSGL